MSKEMLKNMIDMLREEDVETISRVVVRFIPEDIASDDEVQAIARAKADNEETISHEAINWA